jgi:aspartate racemase
MRPVVGVLGGMGPAATADFYAKLVAATPAARDQDHLRVLIWSDPTIPDRTEALLRGGPDPTPALVDGARRLLGAGAELIAVPCNTAHAFLDEVVAQTGARVIHMIDAVSQRIQAQRPQSVGLLATAGTIAAGLYQERLGQAGIAVLTPTSAEQEQHVDAAIAAVKAGRDARALIEPAAAALAGRGAKLLIAGCTELPIALAGAALPVPVLDPTQVLAEATVAAAGAA